MTEAERGGEIRWAYGVTTVPERWESLARTLRSLAAAGFDKPRLFIDGAPDWAAGNSLGLDATCRYPRVHAFGSWLLALQELVVREPTADRYAVFQDDVRACANLRTYLDRCDLHADCYWNLVTYPGVAQVVGPARRWTVGTQSGKGAQGLVFGRANAVALLSSREFVSRCLDVSPDDWGIPKGRRGIDGGVVDAMTRLKVRELVHMPSLLWHDVGEPSTIRPKRQPAILGWPGEDFDCMSFLK